MIGANFETRNLKVILLTVISLCGLTYPTVAQDVAAPLWVINANVIDGLNPETVFGATIVVSGGKIERIDVDAPTPPAGVEVVDVQGRYVVPGLIDAHSHVNDLVGVRRALESGVTTIRTAGVGGFADIGIRDLVKRGLLEGPDIVTSGIFVTPDIGNAVLWDERLYDLHLTGVETEEQLRQLVRINIDHGVDWIKTRTTDRAGLAERDPRTQIYTERQIRVIVEEAARAGISVMVHAHGDAGVRAAVLGGAKSIEHATYASEETLQLMVEHGTYLIPTLSSISSFGTTGTYSDPALYLRGLHMAPRRRGVARRAHELGIPLVAGIDSYYREDSNARVSREVGFLVDQGVPPFDAICGATSLAAEMLGVADQTGSIQPGLDADLLVVDLNPLDDIRSLQDVLVVISNGHVVLKRIPFEK